MLSFILNVLFYSRLDNFFDFLYIIEDPCFTNNMTNDDINSKIGINLKSAKRNSKLSTFSKNRSCRK